MHTAATELNCRHGIARMFVIFEHQISIKRTSESTIMPGIHARPFSCHSQAYLYYGIHWYYVDLIFDWFNMSHIIASEMKNLWLRDGSSENIFYESISTKESNKLNSLTGCGVDKHRTLQLRPKEEQKNKQTSKNAFWYLRCRRWCRADLSSQRFSPDYLRDRTRFAHLK